MLELALISCLVASEPDLFSIWDTLPAQLPAARRPVASKVLHPTDSDAAAPSLEPLAQSLILPQLPALPPSAAVAPQNLASVTATTRSFLPALRSPIASPVPSPAAALSPVPSPAAALSPVPPASQFETPRRAPLQNSQLPATLPAMVETPLPEAKLPELVWSAVVSSSVCAVESRGVDTPCADTQGFEKEKGAPSAAC